MRPVSGLYNPPFLKIRVGILGKNWWGGLINSLSGHPVETQKMAFPLGLQKVCPVQPERTKAPAGPGCPRKELHTATLRTDGAPHATPGSGTTLWAKALGSPWRDAGIRDDRGRAAPPQTLLAAHSPAPPHAVGRPAAGGTGPRDTPLRPHQPVSGAAASPQALLWPRTAG